MGWDGMGGFGVVDLLQRVASSAGTVFVNCGDCVVLVCVMALCWEECGRYTVVIKVSTVCGTTLSRFRIHSRYLKLTSFAIFTTAACNVNTNHSFASIEELDTYFS